MKKRNIVLFIFSMPAITALLICIAYRSSIPQTSTTTAGGQNLPLTKSELSNRCEEIYGYNTLSRECIHDVYKESNDSLPEEFKPKTKWKLD
jgi:hypothetical protein